MVKHIVMWRFKNEAEGRTKLENMELVKEKLYALKEIIPEIKSIEIGANISRNEAAYDMALVSVFDNIAALERYEIHPKHKEVSQYVKKIRTDRAVTDYIF